MLCYAQNSSQESTIKYKFSLITYEFSVKHAEKKVRLNLVRGRERLGEYQASSQSAD